MSEVQKPVAIARGVPVPSNTLGGLFTRAGLTKGIDTSIVLGKDADHLLVIQAIAADGLTTETTPERRMVLEAIRTAVERTLALQGVAQ
jgi:hypothetical protein